VKPKVQGLIYDESKQAFKINELEISITSKCHLRCENCGFYIPEQPNPSITDNIVEEIVAGLSHLQRLNIRIGSLAILGGEPTYNQQILETSLREFSMFKNIQRIEVVSHGLTPQSISKEALKFINKLTISIYFDSEELILLWKNFLNKFAPHIELNLRTDKEWDKWLGDEVVDDNKAKEMFDYCWYRKHCVTLERQRLFMCSRIAKLSQDKEGIILNQKTSFDDVKNYLNQTSFIASCKTCTPMMGLPTVKAGQQPDGRILKLIPTAINFLQTALNGKS
jgi:organic radical activating enzyme